jgi:hypothetical protein
MINERHNCRLRPMGRNRGFQAWETIMNGVLTNALIAAGAIGVIGYALITHLQHRGPRSRAGAGGDRGGGDSYSDRTNDGFSPGSWFSSDSSGSSTDGSSCSTGDSGGGDCGGGDSGGGAGGD